MIKEIHEKISLYFSLKNYIGTVDFISISKNTLKMIKNDDLNNESVNIS